MTCEPDIVALLEARIRWWPYLSEDMRSTDRRALEEIKRLRALLAAQPSLAIKGCVTSCRT